jgi:hypothetical protein
LRSPLGAGRPQVHLGNDAPPLAPALPVGPCPARLRAEASGPSRTPDWKRLVTTACRAHELGRGFVTRRNGSGTSGSHRLVTSSSAASISLSPEG